MDYKPDEQGLNFRKVKWTRVGKKQELANMNLSCTIHSPAQVPPTFYLLLFHQIKATTADPSSTGHQQTT
jgi:hypothetical protein